MWRKSNYEEDWERRKAYLIRSLFEDVPLLSPVQEADESFDSSPSHGFPTSTTTRECLDRPYSPLPPLIIEKEPNRHDEPEEYYCKLEKKIMRIYKRMFIEDRSDVDGLSDSTDLSSPKKRCYLERRASFGEGYTNENANLLASDVCMTENNGTMDCGMENKNGSKDISNNLNDDSRPKENTEVELNETDPDTRILEEKKRSIIEVLSDLIEEENQSTSSYLPKSTSEGSATYIIEESIGSSSDTSEKTTYDKTYFTQKESNSRIGFLQRSVSDEIGTYEEGSGYAEAYHNRSEEISEKAETISVLSNAGYRQVTFKADVHRDVSEQDVQIPPSLIYEEIVREEDIADDAFDENNDNLAELEENSVSDINQNTTSEDEPREIEEMRTPRVYMSTGSMRKRLCDSHSSGKDMTERPRSLEAQTETDNSKESETNAIDFEKSIDYNVLQTSVFNEEIQKENFAPKTVITSKRKRFSSPATSSKRARYEDINVQATLEDEDLNRRIFCDNIFAGQPRVFRLCSCLNHLCVASS